jgi:hypothetical protein
MSNMPANVRISAQFPFPSGVAGTTPIAITKANGIWSVALPLDALATQNPSGGSLTTDYLLVWDSLTGTYFKMPISNVPTGPPGPPGAAGPPGPSGGITDAPSDGVNYGRKNAAWNNLDTLYAPIAAAAPLDALAYNGMQVNGSMEVSQELGTAGTGTNAKYICDGWQLLKGGVPVVLAQQFGSSLATGFQSFIGVTVSTAQPSLAAGDFACVTQMLEGYRISRLGWGTANAQPITIGFWSDHTGAGVYSGTVRNGAVTRSYAFTYTQNVSNIPQYNTVTIPGCTDGVWPSDNTLAMTISFAMASGSTLTAPSANTWLNGNYIAAPGQVNSVATTSGVLRITGVIVLPGIEVPTAARSAFIMRPFDQELDICQRYYEKSYLYTSAPGSTIGGQLHTGAAQWWGPTLTVPITKGIYIPFKRRKRATPTATIYSPVTGLAGKIYDLTQGGDWTGTVQYLGDTSINITALVNSGVTNTISAHWIADARL